MLRTAQERVSEFREAMRGGEGTIEIKNLFQPGDLRGKARLVAEIKIPVGGSIGFHRHEQEEEIYYFISGRGMVDDQGTKYQVGSGDALLTGNGDGHSVANIGAEPLVFMAVILVY